MSDDENQTNPWHWYEYEVGLAGEIARACVRSLTSFLIGLGCAFALIMGMGFLAEEDLLDDPGLEEADVSVHFLPAWVVDHGFTKVPGNGLTLPAAARCCCWKSGRASSRT